VKCGAEPHYNYYRDYDPQVGRYVESDPIGLIAGVNTYVYALNNSMSSTDPTGLDINVCFFPGGVGHVGIGVNSSTQGLYPQARQMQVGLCRNVPGVIKMDSPAHDWVANSRAQCLTIRTSPVQDALAKYFIEGVKNSVALSYNLCTNQCTTFVRTALNFAGVPLPADAQYSATDVREAIQQTRPVNFYGALRRAYSPGYGGSW
jgi:hypothetical protein